MTAPRSALLGCALSLALSAPVEAQDRSIFSLLDTSGRTVTVDASQTGRLSGSDALSAGGRRVQAWVLAADAGAEIQVDLRSDDFDAFLYLVGPGFGAGLRDDDGGDGLNSRLCASVGEPGEYRLIASALDGGTGDFTLQVMQRPGASEGVCPESGDANEVTDLAQLPTDGRTLAPGDEVEGYLGSTDATVYGAPAQAWAVEGRAGAPFSVDLRSDVFDAYLMMEGPGLDRWLEDDDGAGRCDSRITLDFPTDGTYRVVVSSLGAAVGSFRLIASEAPAETDPASCLAAELGSERTGSEIVGVAVGSTVEPDVTYDAVMTGDEGTVDGRYVQAWSLNGSAGDRYAIEVVSDAFDTYAYLGGPGFDELAYDDDGAGDLDARICVELPEDGTYTVYGGPYSGRETGEPFTVRAARADAETLCAGGFERSAAAVSELLAALPTEGRTIGVGEEQTGLLDPAGARHPDADRPVQAWTLDVPEGQTVFVDVVSDELDPVLYVVGPGLGPDAFADDFGDGCNARLELVSPGPGTVLLPGGYYSEASGSYRLRVTTDPPPMEEGGCVTPDTGPDSGGGATDASDVSLDHLSSGTARRLAIGTEAEGTLGPNDEALQSGVPAQSWAVDVRAGDELVFELLSDDFDPVLYLDTGGTLGPLMDDDGAGSLNSRIVFLPAVDRTLRLVVTALSTEGAGSFRLRALRRVR